ncbi:MAG: TetR/AcrR family transcriptional regulator [Jatrophihabitans sp.]
MTSTVTRPQQARALATRDRLLEASLLVLYQRGYAATTTTAVCVQAGVSRGTQLHHFPSKAELVRASIEHLADKRAAEMRTELTGLPPAGDRIDAALALLERTFTSRLYSVALEVWMAARTDPELRAALAPLERRIGRELFALTVEVLGVDSQNPDARQAVRLTLDLMRGLGVAALLTDDQHRRRRLLAWHADQLRRLLGQPR